MNGLAIVIRFPQHRVRSLRSRSLIEAWAELDAQTRLEGLLFGVCALGVGMISAAFALVVSA